MSRDKIDLIIESLRYKENNYDEIISINEFNFNKEMILIPRIIKSIVKGIKALNKKDIKIDLAKDAIVLKRDKKEDTYKLELNTEKIKVVYKEKEINIFKNNKYLKLGTIDLKDRELRDLNNKEYKYSAIDIFINNIIKNIENIISGKLKAI